MKDIREIANYSKIDTRLKILEDYELSMRQIYDHFLRRACREGISDERALKLINFLSSEESFKEIESYFFWCFNPKTPKEWHDILDHIYRRSITQTYFMN